MNKTNDSQGLITSSLSRGTRRLQLLPQCRLRWMRISLLPLPPDMALICNSFVIQCQQF
ncbi:hypothetical protein Goklo_023840 [Gossypium klotzschianum]|uniref:Uncharacterized protein n=1 Tax=Gossypium klotzschianum TaxID=34286 RepID=A0A7J8W8V4_9ROSI|nr:hypothetical protein [Gossypium klotzschianum]